MKTMVEGTLSALDVIYTRRSVRSYTRDRIDEATVRGLIDAAVQAPTAMLEQPWAFAVVQDDNRLRRLSDRAKAIWIREAEAPHQLHLKHTSNLHGDFVKRLARPEFNVFYDATTLIVICARRTDGFVIPDCWLAAENLMLAAWALGLGTCCIGAAAPALNTPEGKVELGIPADVTAVVPIIVGVPSGDAAPVARRDPEILSWK